MKGATSGSRAFGGPAGYLLGRPIVTSNYVPEIGAGNRSLVFGDFSYYWIVDRRGRFMQRLGELFAKTGQVGFRLTSGWMAASFSPRPLRCLSTPRAKKLSNGGRGKSPPSLWGEMMGDASAVADCPGWSTVDARPGDVIECDEATGPSVNRARNGRAGGVCGGDSGPV